MWEWAVRSISFFHQTGTGSTLSRGQSRTFLSWWKHFTTIANKCPCIGKPKKKRSANIGRIKIPETELEKKGRRRWQRIERSVLLQYFNWITRLRMRETRGMRYKAPHGAYKNILWEKGPWERPPHGPPPTQCAFWSLVENTPVAENGLVITKCNLPFKT